MRTEREKMLAGDLYDPLDPELVLARNRARDLCQALNATREEQQEERRRLLTELLSQGGGEVWLQQLLSGPLHQTGQAPDYNFGARDAMICSKRASLRNGSQTSSSLSDP